MNTPRILFLGAALLFLSATTVHCAISSEDKIAKLKAAVSHLSETTDAEKAKKAVLEVAVERAFRAGKPVVGEALVNDGTAGLSCKAEEMARVNAQAKHVTALAPVPVTKGNPYLDALVANAREELAVAESAWLQGPFDPHPKELGNTRATRAQHATCRRRCAVTFGSTRTTPVRSKAIPNS